MQNREGDLHSTTTLPDFNSFTRQATSAPPFDGQLNWSHAQNCTPNPQPQNGICTLLGPSKDAMDWATAMRMSLNLLKSVGLQPSIPVFYFDGPSDRTDSYDYGQISFSCNELLVGYIDVHPNATHPWIFVRCPVSHDGLVRLFSQRFAISRLQHEVYNLRVIGNWFWYQVIMVTGDAHDANPYNNCRSVGSFFKMIYNREVIAKALVAYSNAAIGLAGPTLELIEVAREWRNRGVGVLFMRTIEDFMRTTFQPTTFADDLSVHISFVTSPRACQWFLSQGYKDVSRGEEFSKRLSCCRRK